MLEVLLHVVELEDVHDVRGSVLGIELSGELDDARSVPASRQIMRAIEPNTS
jgi:hypothetical protein